MFPSFRVTIDEWRVVSGKLRSLSVRLCVGYWWILITSFLASYEYDEQVLVVNFCLFCRYIWGVTSSGHC